MLNTSQIDFGHLELSHAILGAAISVDGKMELLKSIVNEIRKIDPFRKEKIVHIHLHSTSGILQLDEEVADIICGLTGTTEITIEAEPFYGTGNPALTARTVDFDLFVYGEHLNEKTETKKFDRSKTEKQIAGLQTKLSNPDFLSKAPEKVINDTRTMLEELQRLLQS